MNFESAAQQYEQVFKNKPQVVAHAPGRVNIIGEHVDYNDGLVLPFAIAQRIVVAAGLSDSGTVSVHSATINADTDFPVTVDAPTHHTAWENYIRGVAHGLREEGISVPGANVWIGGTLPISCGISSSAALCVSFGYALAGLAGAEVAPERMARIAQAAEHKFAGMPCGIMDQMASCCSTKGHALLLDCRDLSHRNIPCVPEGLSFVVIPSGVKHALVEGAYEQRVISCQKALEEFQKEHADVTSLRDVSTEMFDGLADNLDNVTRRRTRHVISEISRVTQAVSALESQDWSALGNLLWKTQDSLRDDYEVSCPEIDSLIDTLHDHDAVLGARMVGGGFGGIVIALTKSDQVDSVVETVATKYYSPRQLSEHTFVVEPSEGAGLCEL